MTFAGAVLCGGASSRMGTDKSLLSIDGQVRAVAATQLLASSGAAETVCLGGNRQALDALGLTVIDDHMPLNGPLAAITNGLKWAIAHGHSALLVVACDMPNITGEMLAWLVDAPTSWDCCVIETNFGIEPLCALYSVSCHDTFARQLTNGERSIQRAVRSVGYHGVHVANESLVLNVNSPDDLA